MALDLGTGWAPTQNSRERGCNRKRRLIQAQIQKKCMCTWCVGLGPAAHRGWAVQGRSWCTLPLRAQLASIPCMPYSELAALIMCGCNKVTLC